jgi:hypothetical protein
VGANARIDHPPVERTVTAIQKDTFRISETPSLFRSPTTHSVRSLGSPT